MTNDRGLINNLLEKRGENLRHWGFWLLIYMYVRAYTYAHMYIFKLLKKPHIFMIVFKNDET